MFKQFVVDIPNVLTTVNKNDFYVSISEVIDSYVSIQQAIVYNQHRAVEPTYIESPLGTATMEVIPKCCDVIWDN